MTTEDLEFAQALAEINWQRPWLAHLRSVGEPLAQLAQARGAHTLRERLSGLAQGAGLVSGQGMPLCFIPQESLLEGQAYEAHIFATGEVPTRANLHDFFNALIWLHFPKLKRALNARQAAEIARHGVSPTRGGTRDAATLFDENAVLFIYRDARLYQVLQGFAWHELFLEHRSAWHAHCTALIFGHALLEKLVQPYKAITGHAWPCALPAQHEAACGNVDALLAPQLPVQLRSQDFSPLPVLGIPDWWAENAAPMFYNDSHVFRAGRMRQRATASLS